MVSLIYLATIDNAILGLSNLEVGTKMTSASVIKFKARMVNNSGSPGPHPTQKSFI